MGGRFLRSWLGDETSRSRVFLIAAAALFLFTPIGGPTLWDKHEGRFVSAAFEMIRSGDWVVPRNDGVPVVFYPPLLTWLIALSGLLFGGLSEFAAKFPSALASLGCVLLTFEIGRRLFDRATGLYAGFILLTTLVWERYSCACQPDSLMTFFFMLGLWAFLQAQSETPPRRRWSVVIGLALGGAFMAKGPLGVVLVLLVTAGFLAWERRLRSAWNPRLLVVAATAAAVSIPWFVAVYFTAGPAFLSSLWHETLDMAAGGKMLMHKEPFFYYVPRFFYSTVLWFVFFIAALMPAGARRPAERASWRFCCVWIAGIFLLLSLSQAKRTYYVLPFLPAVAIVTATWWTRGRDGAAGAWSKWRDRGPWALLLGAAVVALAVAPFVPARLVARSGLGAAMVPLAFGGLFAVGLFAWLHFRESPARSFAAYAGFLFVGLGVTFNVGPRWGDADGREAVAFCRQVRAFIPPGDLLFTSSLPPQATYYLDAPHIRAAESEDLLKSVPEGHTAWLLIEKNSWEEKLELRLEWKRVCEDGLEDDPIVLCRRIGGAHAAGQVH